MINRIIDTLFCWVPERWMWPELIFLFILPAGFAVAMLGLLWWMLSA